MPEVSYKDLELLSEVPRPFDRAGWLFELKYDGFRAIALNEQGRVRLLSRKGNDLAPAFPEIAAEIATLPDCSIDGELTVLDARGIPQFDPLAVRARKSTPAAIKAAARQTPAAFMAFDLLTLDGQDLRARPLAERKRALAQLLGGLKRVKSVQYIEAQGSELYRTVEQMGLEGIVAKNASAPYRRGRSRDWLKIKTKAGKTKTEKRGDAWYGGPKVPRALRSGEADSVEVEVGGHAIELKHLDKVLWPARRGLPQFTKRQFLTYLLETADVMLPHLANRPLTLFFMPDGIEGYRSVEMHWEKAIPPFIQSVPIYSSNKRGAHRYLLCNNAASLMWLANAGVLEFHTWHSRIDPQPDAQGVSTDAAASAKALERSLLNRPDYIFFDLDPYIFSGNEPPGAEPEYHPAAFERCKEAAFRLRELLASVALEALVKTSGRTGLHVIAPIARTIDFTTAREVAREFCKRLMDEQPGHFTLDARITNRTGRTYLDYNMNRRAASMAAPYSPRALAGAIVSMPITWDELAGADPLSFRMDTALQRTRRAGDPWKRLLDLKQPLGRPAT
jgi:DNA ligase D-like protein (predicted polymerase)